MQKGDYAEGNEAEKGGDSAIIMKKEREFIPKPRSSFVLIKCPDCGEERVMFSASTRDITCRGCGRKLAERTGGKVRVDAQIIKRLD